MRPTPDARKAPGPIRPVFLALTACLLAAPTLAQQPSQAQANAIRQSCRGDYQAYCSSVPPGGQASLACLQQNAASLSPPCQSALAAISGGAGGAAAATASRPPPRPMPARPPMSPRQEIAVLRGACGADYRAFCRGVQPGGGRALACLKAYGPSLSRPCQQTLMSMRGAR